MIRALQKRFILSSMLAVTVLLTVLLGAINTGNIAVSARQSQRTLSLLLAGETGPGRPPREEGPKAFFGGGADENSRKAAVYFAVRVDGNGNVMDVKTDRIASVTAAQAEELCLRQIEKGLTSGRTGSYLFSSSENMRDKSTLYVFLDTSLQLRDNLRLIFFSSVAGIACWLAMLLLVLFLSRRAIRPIAENIARQKQFVTDAGHEIKTPLAIILANTEAMELYEGENKWSRNIREQTERLNGLMQNLLSLSKADEGGLTLHREQVLPGDEATDILQMFSESMEIKEIRLTKHVEDGLTMRTDRELIRRLFSILADNAVKYSPEKGEITVTLTRHGRRILFSIENQCGKLPSCPPEKLFDRFCRGDAARTQKDGGYGIGLSAARSIVELCGGTIHAEYSPPDRIKFTVSF